VRFPYHYLISGRRVASRFALPGCVAAAPCEDADLTIDEGAVPVSLAERIDTGPNWQLARDRIVLEVPGIARLLIEPRRILVARAASDDAEAIGVQLAGSAFALALQLQGRILLRASAVAVGGRAVLFCGDPGAGKSVLAAALGAAGHALVADDRCVVTIGERGISTIADCGGVRLWSSLLVPLGLDRRPRARLRAGFGKFVVEPAERISAPLPVAALYVLETSRSGAPHIVKLPPAAAALQPWRSAFHPALVRRLGQIAGYFEASAALLRDGGGVFALSRPVSLAGLGATIATLEAHWAELGLTEPAL
jgi:hypothetical protein